MTIDDVPSTLDFYDELALLCNSIFSEMHATYWVKKLADVSKYVATLLWCHAYIPKCFTRSKEFDKKNLFKMKLTHSFCFISSGL